MEDKQDNGVRFRRPNPNAFADWEKATKHKPPTALDLVGGIINLCFLPVVLVSACLGSSRKVLSMSTKHKIAIIAAVLVALLALTVWPTPYRQDNVKIGDTSYLLRTHRLTGNIQRFSLSGGWYDVKK